MRKEIFLHTGGCIDRGGLRSMLTRVGLSDRSSEAGSPTRVGLSNRCAVGE
jgi:hypothetical protein